MEKDNITTPSALPDYKSEIADVIRSNLSPWLMKEKLLDYHANDIAASLTVLKKDERARLYSILDIVTLSGVLEYAEELGLYLNELSIRKRVDVLSRIEVSTTVEYLAELPKGERNALIELMPEETRGEIVLLASFDKDEIGSKMTTN